ncbi:MAG TPA: VOC family protein [Gammaproteobacteria bacterium]|nr:VOC family protein [Gammaproteobacteria bacterium]
MIIGIHHAQITIPKGKEKEARDFYCGVMGLKENPKPKALQGRGGFWLQVGDKQVHVGTEDGVDRALSKAHIAYEVNDLTHWRKHMAANHIEIFSGEPIPGLERFEFRDPFGNRVELIQKL